MREAPSAQTTGTSRSAERAASKNTHTHARARARSDTLDVSASRCTSWPRAVSQIETPCRRPHVKKNRKKSRAGRCHVMGRHRHTDTHLGQRAIGNDLPKSVWPIVVSGLVIHVGRHVSRQTPSCSPALGETDTGVNHLLKRPRTELRTNGACDRCESSD
jgi:hypothetical protein